tara:strand:+ start:24137 stop:25540 length:1404 start_codon:yes stop_codon:yes gene_type:complete
MADLGDFLAGFNPAFFGQVERERNRKAQAQQRQQSLQAQKDLLTFKSDLERQTQQRGLEELQQFQADRPELFGTGQQVQAQQPSSLGVGQQVQTQQPLEPQITEQEAAQVGANLGDARNTAAIAQINAGTSPEVNAMDTNIEQTAEQLDARVNTAAQLEQQIRSLSQEPVLGVKTPLGRKLEAQLKNAETKLKTENNLINQTSKRLQDQQRQKSALQTKIQSSRQDSITKGLDKLADDGIAFDETALEGKSFSQQMAEIRKARAFGKREKEEQKLRQKAAKPLGKEATQLKVQSQAAIKPLDTLISGIEKGEFGGFEQALANFPVFSGVTLPGDLARAFNTDSQKINLLKNQISSLLLRMRSGAAVTDSEAARFDALLPKGTRSDELDIQSLKDLKIEMSKTFDEIAAGRKAITDPELSMEIFGVDLTKRNLQPQQAPAAAQAPAPQPTAAPTQEDLLAEARRRGLI